jgi:hypothetical protein
MSQFILYFDGEKDPRNLMVVFSILRVPMTEWNIGADAQVCPLLCGNVQDADHDSYSSTRYLIISQSRLDHPQTIHMASQPKT